MAEFPARRVHALENELWVVLVPAERDIDDDQFGEPIANCNKITLAGGDQFAK